MGSPSNCSVHIGNLDERVSERVLYDILIQAGRVVELYIPRDKENDRPKGYAFVEYESEEIAEYAVKLFSGLVTLYNRTLRFTISGQDKASQNLSAGFSTHYSPNKSRSQSILMNNSELSHQSIRASASSRFSPQQPSSLSRALDAPHYSNGYASNLDGSGS